MFWYMPNSIKAYFGGIPNNIEASFGMFPESYGVRCLSWIWPCYACYSSHGGTMRKGLLLFYGPLLVTAAPNGVFDVGSSGKDSGCPALKANRRRS